MKPGDKVVCVDISTSDVNEAIDRLSVLRIYTYDYNPFCPNGSAGRYLKLKEIPEFTFKTNRFIILPKT